MGPPGGVSQLGGIRGEGLQTAPRRHHLKQKQKIKKKKKIKKRKTNEKKKERFVRL